MFKYYIAKCGVYVETIYTNSVATAEGYAYALGKDYSFHKVA